MPNKATVVWKDFCKLVLTDLKVQQRILQDARDGKLPPHLVVSMAMYYAGRPPVVVQQQAPPPGPAAAPLHPLLDREPVAAQDGSGQGAIAVLTLAFAPVKRAIPGVRLGPAGQAALRPPASRDAGAGGTASGRPMRLGYLTRDPELR